MKDNHLSQSNEMYPEIERIFFKNLLLCLLFLRYSMMLAKLWLYHFVNDLFVR